MKPRSLVLCITLFASVLLPPSLVQAESPPDAERLYSEAMELEKVARSRSVRPDLEKSVELYQKALAIYEQFDMELQVACVTNRLGEIYFDWGEYDKAERLFQKSLDVANRDQGQSGKEQGKALIRLGSVSLTLGRYDQAVNYYEQVLRLRRHGMQKDGEDKLGEAAVIKDLGFVYFEWGRYDRAEKQFRKALKIFTKVAKTPMFREIAKEGAADALDNLGKIYSRRGEYPRAVDAYEKSVRIRDASQNIRGKLNSLPNLAEVYSDWGRHDEALKRYDEALKLAQMLGNKKRVGQILLRRGHGHQNLKAYPKALEDFQLALTVYEEIGVPTLEPKTLLAGLFLSMGAAEAAEPLIRELESDYICVRGKSRVWMLLARFYLSRSDYQRAKTYYQKLLEDAEASKEPGMIFTVNTGLGLTYEAMGKFPQAKRYFRKAIDLTEHLRSSVRKDQRLEFFNVASEGFLRTTPYKGLSRVLCRLNKFDEAFKWSEYTKARVFSEAMSRKPHGTRSVHALASVLAEGERMVLALTQLRRKRKQAYEKETRSVVIKNQLVKNHEDQVKELEKQLQAHIASLREKYPLFAATKYPRPLELRRTRLENNETVLAYDVTETGVIIYLIKGKRVVKALFKAIPRKDLEEIVRSFRVPLEIVPGRDNFNEKLKSFDVTAGKNLSELLLGEVLADLPRGVPVIIVPDECLGRLPFEALILSQSGGKAEGGRFPRLTGVKFFGERNPITYVQSITGLSLARQFGNKQVSADRILVLADPHLDPSKWVRLWETAGLVDCLEELYSGKTDPYVGENASKRVLVEHPLEGYRFIVFGTHGDLDDSPQEVQEPYLVLTPTGPPPRDDGYLRMTEIMGLKLNAEVVALTACKTGLGSMVPGEGAMSLGRAFQYAGTTSVLMSLWSVDVNASVLLMESFFRHLKDGKSKLDALVAAKEDIKNKGYEHPFFWAAFILVGEAR